MAESDAEAFLERAVDPPVRGFLHRPVRPKGDGLVFTHGAGGNAKATMLAALAEVFAGAGLMVLRCDLPFRQARPFGPPRPDDAIRDRQGLKNAVQAMRQLASGHVFLGGQSYGGRQATILCAEEPGLADGLLLTSYPLHPPGKPAQLRVEHFPKLRTPALFVSGTRDPFGSIEEITKALTLIPAKTKLLPAEGVGHDLGFKGKAEQDALAQVAVRAFLEFFNLL
jgi:predicted alpha/beta-hydrolase family hydrolase